MAVEEEQLYLRGGSRPKLEPCLDMLELLWSRLQVIRGSRGFWIIPDFLSPELNWIQQVVGCTRAQEQTTRKNVVLTFKLVDENHKTVVLK